MGCHCSRRLPPAGRCGRGNIGPLLARHGAAEKFAASKTAEYPGQRITVHEGNIGAAGDGRCVLGEVIDQHGRLDVLVNNAGITIAPGPLKFEGTVIAGECIYARLKNV